MSELKMNQIIYEGNRSIVAIRPNDFWYCENQIPIMNLEFQGTNGKLSFFRVLQGQYNEYMVGRAGRIERFNNYIECYEQYQFPKSIKCESRVKPTT
jgi:hypothetical protein